jgi:hypothetical protein
MEPAQRESNKTTDQHSDGYCFEKNSASFRAGPALSGIHEQWHLDSKTRRILPGPTAIVGATQKATCKENTDEKDITPSAVVETRVGSIT